jgi:adenosylhomocysteine nucleosidase
MNNRIIGIMGAMPEEITGIIALLSDKSEITIGKRIYVTGKLNGIDTVVVFSRWGKVAAAATVSTLILKFKITELIFTGVAGGISHNLSIGDIVIAKRLIQHDMDARPLMERFEIPLLDVTYFVTDAHLLDNTHKALTPLAEDNMLINSIGKDILHDFGIDRPALHIGDIASGDQFFASHAQKENLHTALPLTLCVEMEGAAVAQVCYEYEIPFLIFRVISDTADDQSHIDFPKFIQEVSSKYSVSIIKQLYK